MPRCISTLIPFILVTAAVAQPTPQLRHGPAFGTFSSLRFVEESGDLLGYEITIVPQYLSAYAIFQCAEGASASPILTPVTIRGNKITFDINDLGNSCHGHYAGTVSAKGLQLIISGDNKPERLNRQKSYWAH